MKVCKYCGSEAKDAQLSCGSCGAKEFEFKCENCGKVFDSEFCPSCGVRAGQKAKKCPNCGKEYFSNACPNCGYIQQNTQPAYNTYQPNYFPAKKRRTWLWVLGWIFIFPVPLTIIIVRQDKLNTALKITLIVLSWVAFFTLAYIGKAEEDAQQAANTSVTQQIVEEAETQEAETTIESE